MGEGLYNKRKIKAAPQFAGLAEMEDCDGKIESIFYKRNHP